MNAKEVWKQIKGYENRYEVSNLGRVKSVKRKSLFSDGRIVSRKECILLPQLDNKGYYRVSLHKDGLRETVKIHKLVSIAFLNHTPSGYNEVIDHINNIRTDNRVSNLQTTTARHNTTKDRERGLSKYIGVSAAKNKWRARIQINGKTHRLGHFTTEIEASNAYQNALNSL